MYDPRIRFVLLISIIVIITAFANVIYTYVFGEKGLNIENYVTGVALLFSTLLGGYLFIWVGTLFISSNKNKKTGFEPVYVDETGTGFNFPVSLSKYLPEIVAPPFEEGFHPLEEELIGFLKGYKNWPYDISGYSKKSLYEHSMEQWKAVQTLSNTDAPHRIAALAQDLSLVYAYKERRKTYPYSQFWKRDEVHFSRRCEEHGGLSAFILSTLPSFKTLGEDKKSNQKLRRAILTAIRYRDNPTSIPANCDPLAKEIYEYLHKAYQISQIAPGEEGNFVPTDDDVQSLEKQVQTYFQAAIRSLELNPADVTSGNNDGVYLGDGKLLVPMRILAQKFAALVSPSLKGAFHLWDMDGRPHPCWPHFIKALQNMGAFVDTWDGVTSSSGLFNLRIYDVDFTNSVFIQIDAAEMPDLKNILDSLPKFSGLIELQQDKDTLLSELKRKAEQIDKMLSTFLEVPPEVKKQ